jgi:dihydropyrimidinase
MTVDTIIANGRVITPDDDIDASVAIDDGTIWAVGREETLPKGDQRIDAAGKIVMPGAVDPHVHIDEVTGQIASYRSETAAAALGGVTSIIDFAWQGGDRTLDPERSLLDGIDAKRAKGEDALVDFGLHGAITREDPTVFEDVDAAIEQGVTSFKTYMSTNPVGLSNGFIDRVMRELGDRDATILVHTEDPSICEQLTYEMKAAGEGAAVQYPNSRPRRAEAMAAEDAARMAVDADVQYYGMHTTCRAAAEILDQFRTDGRQIRAETCTHYTVYDDSVYAERGMMPLYAPPIRKPDDREAIFEHLEGGLLCVVSSDHVVYDAESKDTENWWDSQFGANSLQVGLPVFYDEAVGQRSYSPSFVVRRKSTYPAETFGFSRKGKIAVGKDADIVIFDPQARGTISAAHNASNADFSIYEGRSVTGQVETTMVRGEVVVENGELVGDPGQGEFVARERPAWDPIR